MLILPAVARSGALAGAARGAAEARWTTLFVGANPTAPGDDYLIRAGLE